MPGRGGLELTTRLNEMHHIPFILLTAYSEKDIIAKATESGAMSYLVKPVDIKQLIPAIETALSRANFQRDLLGSNKNLQAALNADRDLSVAVGIMMVEHCTDRNGAMKLLRQKSRKQQIKLMDIAVQIIDAREKLIIDID
jgi:response regulator NasT